MQDPHAKTPFCTLLRAISSVHCSLIDIAKEISLRMFSRCVRKLFLVQLDPLKCSIHSFSRISDANIKEAVGKRTKVQGWVRALRKMKENVFVDLSDGSTCEMLQVVIPKSNKPDQLSYGSSIVVEGELATAPNGRIELRATDVTLFGTCDVTDGYPFVPRQQHSTDYVRQYLHLRPRTKSFSSLLRLRDIASLAIGDHFRNRGFVNVHTPILTSNDCEGAGELFLVKPQSTEILRSMRKEGIPDEDSYFDTKAYLTVSGQLHLEAVARALVKVYTFGPTFRAENSKSRLHLSEFYMVEAELAFVDSLDEIMNEVELLVKGIAKDVVEKGISDMHLIGAHEPQWLHERFERMTYEDAFNILKNHADKVKQSIKYGDALTKDQELFLVNHNNGVPVFVINWPKENKPFYMKECENDASKVAAMDLLAPGVGELVGGSIREDNYEKLESKLPLTSNISWYLELRKYGNVPTGGFGMGFERFLQCVLGISNIKDTVPFPRWPHNCNL